MKISLNVFLATLMLSSRAWPQGVFPALPTLPQVMERVREGASGRAEAVEGHDLSTEIILALADVLKDNSSDARARAAEELGGFGPRAEIVVPQLIAALKSPGSYWRARAAIAATLGKIGPGAKAAAKLLSEMACYDTDVEVRRVAAAALAPIGERGEYVVSFLVKAWIRNEEGIVRAAAKKSLDALKADPEVKVKFLGQFFDPKIDGKDVRLRAVRALGDMGATAHSMEPVLYQVKARDPEEEVRAAAGQALKRIRGEGQVS